MASKSKTKGNAAEREVAKILSTWFGSDFKRIPNSGALRWGGASFVYGDLLPPEAFPGIIESKFYKQVDLDGLLRLSVRPVNPLGWWLQVVDDVQRCYSDTRAALQPVLIFKANGRPRRLVVEEKLFNALRWGVTPGLQSIPYLSLHRSEFPGTVVIVDLVEFLGMVTPEAFVQAAHASFPECLGEPCG